jgi:pseudouridine synthase
MLLSSDGDLIQFLSHPSSGKEKEYLVTLTKPFDKSLVRSLTRGVELDDGISRFVKASLLQPTKLRLVLTEGRNRQIRRTFEKLGYKVAILERTRIGNISLGTLAAGKYQFVKESDIGGGL